MDRFVAGHSTLLAFNRVIKEGDPAQVIVDYARQHNVDLITILLTVMDVSAFLTGSVTAKVLHDARCPVWTSARVEGSKPRVIKQYRKLRCAVVTVLPCR
jgi:hypothetical protein